MMGNLFVSALTARLCKNDSEATLEEKRTVPENMYTLAARIEDADHGSEWLDSCIESRTVRDVDNPAGTPDRIEFEAYERLKGLPVAGISDRDVYLHGSWRREGKALVCHLSPSAKAAPPPPEDVVRMRDLQGTFKLEPLAPHSTHVTYALKVDLGGSVPDWIKDMAVQQIPQKTLANLAREATRGPGPYEEHGQALQQALEVAAGAPG